ncbi:cellular tumor antigen p53-like isoform X2 [Anneissia japonica]|uniref:cellular tumor antigen p53-like isoform X2 n=1 Tax=Anneissia japonica TaxID=1529436 RepID=UPI0014254B3F|nr:cellular tumor antigen p53-like isoform X2 [Anneissia japonica]
MKHHVINQPSNMNVVPVGPPMPADNAGNFQQDAIPPPPFSPCGAASQPIPSNTEYPGDYNFQIYMGQHAQIVAKSANWTYSSKLNKLYADKDKSFPIQFKTETKPQEQCFIRATPVFKKPGHVQEVVKRCPNHTGEDTKEPSGKHLLICQHQQAEYAQDAGTGRLSVLIPYDEPQVGTEFTTYLFIFKCTISCVGGMNRRPAMLIFTLENKNGATLGRRVIEIRPCACPGRDRKNDEAECGKEKRLKEKPTKKTKVTAQSTTISQVGAKKRKLNTDDEIFTLTIRGRENYEMLRKINEALEIMRNIPPEYRKSSRDIQAHLKRESSRQSNVPHLSSFSNGPALNPLPSIPSIPSFGSLPSFQHIDTLPINQSGGDYADSARPTPSTSVNITPPSAVTCNEVSSSQEQPGPTPLKQEGHQYAQADTTIASWLLSIGCEDCTKYFHDHSIMYLYQLEDIMTPQDLVDLGIPEGKRDTIRRAILDVRSSHHMNLSSTPTLQTGSSITSSMCGNDMPGFLATRFTLKQTFSFKIEDEDEQ